MKEKDDNDKFIITEDEKNCNVQNSVLGQKIIILSKGGNINSLIKSIR